MKHIPVTPQTRGGEQGIDDGKHGVLARKPMLLKDKKVLITGAGGFIGSHLTEALIDAGAKVSVFLHYNSQGSIGNLKYIPEDKRKECDIHFGDIADFHSVKTAMKSCDVVFHLAALIGIPYSYKAPFSYVNTNIVGTLNVMQAGLELGIEKIIHTSTSEAYGTAIYAPIDERHPLQGQSPYSATKISADLLADSYYRSFGLPVVTIRCFNTYGPRQSARAVIPTIIAQLLSNCASLKLGSLDPIRDFNYVLDSVNGFIKIAQTDGIVGELINIGSGRGVSIAETVTLLFELTGKKVPIEADNIRTRPEKSEVMKLLCDNGKAKKLLGWEPQFSLEAGLKQTVEFIRANLAHYSIEQYNI